MKVHLVVERCKNIARIVTVVFNGAKTLIPQIDSMVRAADPGGLGEKCGNMST